MAVKALRIQGRGFELHIARLNPLFDARLLYINLVVGFERLDIDSVLAIEPAYKVFKYNYNRFSCPVLQVIVLHIARHTVGKQHQVFVAIRVLFEVVEVDSELLAQLVLSQTVYLSLDLVLDLCLYTQVALCGSRTLDSYTYGAINKVLECAWPWVAKALVLELRFCLAQATVSLGIDVVTAGEECYIVVVLQDIFEDKLIVVFFEDSKGSAIYIPKDCSLGACILLYPLCLQQVQGNKVCSYTWYKGCILEAKNKLLAYSCLQANVDITISLDSELTVTYKHLVACLGDSKIVETADLVKHVYCSS